MVSIQNGAVVPNAGVTPYDLNTPLFSDYAVKYRTVWLPPGDVPSRTRTRPRFEFPVGHGPHQVVRLPGRLPRRERAGEVGRDARLRPRAERLEGRELRLGRRADGGDHAARRRRSSTSRSSTPTARRSLRATSSPARPVPEVPRERRRDDPARALGDAAQPRLRVPDGTENELAHWTSSASSRARRARRRRRCCPSSTIRRPATWRRARARTCRPTAPTATTATARRARRGSCSSTRETDPYALGVCKPPVAAGKAAQGRALRHRPGPARSSQSSSTGWSRRSRASRCPSSAAASKHVEAVAVVSDWITQMTASCQ